MATINRLIILDAKAFVPALTWSVDSPTRFRCRFELNLKIYFHNQSQHFCLEPRLVEIFIIIMNFLELLSGGWLDGRMTIALKGGRHKLLEIFIVLTVKDLMFAENVVAFLTLPHPRGSLGECALVIWRALSAVRERIRTALLWRLGSGWRCHSR